MFKQRRAGNSKIGTSEIYLAAWHVLVTALRPPELPERGAGHRDGPVGDSTR